MILTSGGSTAQITAQSLLIILTSLIYRHNIRPIDLGKLIYNQMVTAAVNDLQLSLYLTRTICLGLEQCEP
jgi:hypothetical protein